MSISEGEAWMLVLVCHHLPRNYPLSPTIGARPLQQLGVGVQMQENTARQSAMVDRGVVVMKHVQGASSWTRGEMRWTPY